VDRRFWFSLGASLVGGLVMTLIAVYCWGYIATYTPVLGWLLDLGLHDTGLRLALFPIDFFTNVALSLPLAFVLLKLQPRKLWLHLLVAIVPSFIWLNFPLVGNEVFYQLWASFIPGWLYTLCALPVAVLLVWQFSMPAKPNKFMHATCEDARA
jgi:hypothetical protein